MNWRNYILSLSVGLFALTGVSPRANASDPPQFQPWMLKENPEIYPLKKVKTGQIAEGISVFSSVKGPEAFKAEILGVVENFFGPAGDLIIARLYGGPVDKTGVVAGMSGSPVFMDKKLVGAVGYRFGAFTADAIAGITPMGQMLETFQSQSNASTRSKSAATAWGQAVPLASPIVFSGLLPHVQNAFASHLSDRGYGILIPAVGTGAGGSEAHALQKQFFPGGPIATTLVDGDMKMAGIGTITWVDKDRFLAFGHPFMGLGKTDIPVSYAKIVTTVASEAGSWKLGRPTQPAGKLTHDRIFAIGGSTDLKPTLVPLSVTLQGEGFGIVKGSETFNYQLANHPTDLPVFCAIVSANTMENRNMTIHGGTLRMTGQITLSDGKEIAVNETVVSHRSSLAMPAAFALLGQLENILNYELAEVSVARLDLNMSHNQTLSAEEVLGVRWSGDWHAGENTKLWVQMKPFQKEMREDVFEFRLPKGLKSGNYEMKVLDRRGYRYFARHRGLLRRVDTLEAFLEQQARLPAADEMTIVLVAPQKGVRLLGTNVQPISERLHRLLGSGAGHVRGEGDGLTIELGRFKRPGYFMGDVSANVEILGPESQKWR